MRRLSAVHALVLSGAVLAAQTSAISTPTVSGAPGVVAPRPVIAALLLGELPAIAEAHGSTTTGRRTRGAASKVPDLESRPDRTPPPTATSQYLKTTDPRRMDRLGCAEGRHLLGRQAKSAIVVLAFGRPMHKAGH
jgi:hypothetical protein